MYVRVKVIYEYYIAPLSLTLSLETQIGNSTVTYTTIFAQRSGLSRTLWVPFETMLNWHFSRQYLGVLYSTGLHRYFHQGDKMKHKRLM